MLGNFLSFLSFADFFENWLFQKILSVTNGLDQVQDQQSRVLIWVQTYAKVSADVKKVPLAMNELDYNWALTQKMILQHAKAQICLKIHIYLSWSAPFVVSFLKT